MTRTQARIGFERAFHSPATHVARAPGRVNLIGEHVDYCGLAVLPAAIQREVCLAFTPRDDARVRLVNADASRFAAREFEVSEDVDTTRPGDWSNYARAAARELALSLGAKRGLDACVAGDVPLAAGLSSSSALLVACVLALATANGIEAPREELMELCARAERGVGVESGGMDQAVSLGGRAGCAVLVEFDPVRTHPVAIPASWRFVVANSGVGAEKAGRAREAYNERVAECRAALLRLLASSLAAGWPRSWAGLVRDVSEAELLAVGARVLEGDLARRFRHVVSEGFRVRRAVQALEQGDAQGFGRLMDLSHASLRDDYAVSCRELDDCVSVARGAGALGARLTGAGFGGSIVALARTDEAGGIEAALRAHLEATPGSDTVFVASASDGAAVSRA